MLRTYFRSTTECPPVNPGLARGIRIIDKVWGCAVSIAYWTVILLIELGRLVKRLTSLNGTDMSNIDAEYEALCVSEGALV